MGLALLAAFFAGLATSTKYNAAIVAAPLLWVVMTRRNGPPLATRIGQAALVPVVMFLAFFMTSPFAVIEYPQLMKAFGEISSHLTEGHSVNLGRGWVVHLTSTLRYGLGLPLLVVGIAGLCFAIAKGWREGVMVAIFPVTYYLVVGSGYTTFTRYILPVVPFLCLAAAFLTCKVARLAGARARIASWVLALLVVSPSAWSVLQFDRLLARTDSRVLAEHWVMEH